MTPKIYAISFLSDVEKLFKSEDLKQIKTYISGSKDIMGYATNRAAIRSCENAESYKSFLINFASELTKEISVEILNSTNLATSQLIDDINGGNGLGSESKRKPRLALAFQILEQSKLESPIVAIKALHNATTINLSINKVNPFDFGANLILKGRKDGNSDLRFLSQSILKNELKKELLTPEISNYKAPKNNA